MVGKNDDDILNGIDDIDAEIAIDLVLNNKRPIISEYILILV